MEPDYGTGKAIVELEVAARLEDVERYQGKELDVKIVQHSQPKTDPQRKYYWELLTQVAAALNLPNPRVHNMMLIDYGQIDIVDDEITYCLIPDTEKGEKWAMNQTMLHLRPTSDVTEDGRKYMLLKGSSRYTSREMSVLIEGLVSTAKDLGIETLTPDELAKLRGYERAAQA